MKNLLTDRVDDGLQWQWVAEGSDSGMWQMVVAVGRGRGSWQWESFVAEGRCSGSGMWQCVVAVVTVRPISAQCQ